MAVQFILGRSGAGKTDLCIRSVAQSLQEDCTSPLILLVPEQATYQAERAILAQKNIPGYSRLHILSFDRLRFLLLKSNAAHDEISRIGREMLVHKVLTENCDKLKLLAGPAQTIGLAAELTKLIVELHQAAKDPDDLDSLTQALQKQQTDTITAAKFHDLALIYRLYLNEIEPKFLNPDIQLTKARQKVPTAPFLQKAKIWLDGFASFTIQQTQLLAELLKVASDTSIALCLDPELIDTKKPDPEKLDPLSLFSPTEQTYAELVGIVKKTQTAPRIPHYSEQPRSIYKFCRPAPYRKAPL